MDSRALMVVLLMSVLAFGCCMAPPGEAAAQNTTGLPGQPMGGQPNGGNQPAGGNGGAQPNNANDLTGKTYEELIALGIPLQCEVVTTSGTTTFYKGIGDDMRTEMASNEGTCPKVIGIVKGDTYYVGCEGGDIMPGTACKWLMFVQNETGAGGAAGSYEAPDYSDVPPAKITCVPWVPDASKLQAPAGACSMDDLLKNFQTK